MKGGIGSATVQLDRGVLVSALVAVNAFGDVRDPSTRKIIAGARRAADSSDFADSDLEMKHHVHGGFGEHNSTLAVVATNARLSKAGSTRLAEMGNLGMARAISPVFTEFDGDLCFALSLGSETADLNALGTAAAEAVGQAIVRAVRSAATLGGVPGLAGVVRSRQP
jgi:L-aminopeptidase/D-esterase-like protein